MKEYFSLVAKEFLTRSAQLKEFIRHHGPTIGTANEVLLRSFLKQYLPNWVSVSHGFIIDQDGNLSRECDILIYNSIFYAPLYKVDDFVVLQPESVIAVIEVKTRLTKKLLQEAFNNLIAAKKFNHYIETSVFIYNPPNLKTIMRYIKSFDFSSVSENHIPENIYGLTKYVIKKMDYVDRDDDPNGVEGISYLNFDFHKKRPDGEFVFENFYYNLYKKVENSINSGLKSGIDNVIEIVPRGKDFEIGKFHGRMRYFSAEVKEVQKVATVKIKSKTQ